MIVAIDGPAGSGKSTVARALAAREGFTYLDTGAMYRAVTLACLEAGLDCADAEAAAQMAQTCAVAFEPTAEPGDAPRVLLNGADVTEAIRTAQVDQQVSAVAAVPAVREALVAQQRRLAQEGDVVAEGRDIGTAVFPQAEVKVFLSADPEARAWRRTVEREGNDPTAPGAQVRDQALYQSILRDIQARDAKDEARAASPLKAADDAVPLDSTKLTAAQTLDAIAALVDARRAAPPATEGASRPEAPAEKDAGQPGAGNPQAACPNHSDGTSDAKAAHDAKAPKAAQDDRGAQAPKGPKAPKAPKATKGKKAGRKMRAFHCTFDDYAENAIDDWPLPSRLWYDVMCGCVYGFSKLYWPWVFEGGDELIERLQGRDKGTVLVQNHVSMVEPVLTVVWFWSRGLRCRPMYKQEFEKNDFLRWIFSRTGSIPVHRGTADLKSLRRCQRALQRGESVLIYPEGTRIRDDETKATIHGGFALVAQMAKTDVTPSAVVGVRAVTPQNKLPARPHRVWFKVGRPLAFGELGVKGRKQQLDAMEQRAMDRVWELRAQLRAEHPGEW